MDISRLTPELLASLPDDERKAALAALDEIREVTERNPLVTFRPHPKQAPFFEATSPIIAAFAGNRFGKTTALTVRSLIECCDERVLPSQLVPFKRWGKERPCFGRIVNPSFALLDGVILPAFRMWCPKDQLLGGSFDKAFQGPPNRLLRFRNGSWVQFMTHEQDLDKFGGAALHFVGYDEPPPKAIREECMMRLADFDGYEMFAMTPLKANTGWIKRDIFKRREAPHVTVLQGSIHDNPNLSQVAKDRVLAEIGSDLWRAAREHGSFIDLGGMIYPEFERSVASEPFEAEFIRSLDVVVGIDPGIRNAGIVWVGFDSENQAFVFDEALLQDSTPAQYATVIRDRNQAWGIVDPHYVVDPAARSRGQTNAETVLNLLIQEDIPANPGQNDVEAGIGQLRTRMQHGRFHVSPRCRGLRDEADDYSAEEPKEGRDDSHLVPIKSNDHRLDALRYACMERVWDPIVEDEAPERVLGWEPGVALPASVLVGGGGSAPMGDMS